MKPVIQVQSSGHGKLLNLIKECIKSINCDKYFSTNFPIEHSAQRKVVDAFQNVLLEKLSEAAPNVKWIKEHIPEIDGGRDRIDIFGEYNKTVIVIELDKWRADQVAKKFLSREAIFHDRKIYYISICYSGTENMNERECCKYFGFCKTLSEKMGNEYAGFIVE